MAEPDDFARRPKLNRTINFTAGDIDLLDWLCEYLGCSQAEAVRSAVRSFAGQLSQIEKRGRPGP